MSSSISAEPGAGPGAATIRIFLSISDCCLRQISTLLVYKETSIYPRLAVSINQRGALREITPSSRERSSAPSPAITMTLLCAVVGPCAAPCTRESRLRRFFFNPRLLAWTKTYPSMCLEIHVRIYVLFVSTFVFAVGIRQR